MLTAERPHELFNLGDDIAEPRNLYAERPEVARELGVLRAKVKAAGGSRPPLVQNDSMLSE